MILELKIKNFGSNAGLPNDNALRFKPFYDGSLFTMVFSHIYYWTGSGFNVFRPDKLPKNIDLKSILLDSEGNYWVGTSANGLFQLRPSAISMIDSDDGLENEKMLSLSIDEDGTGILSTNCGGIYDWDGEKANYSKLQNYLDGGCNWAVLHDSKGRYWIGGGALYMTESIDAINSDVITLQDTVDVLASHLKDRKVVVFDNEQEYTDLINKNDMVGKMED